MPDPDSVMTQFRYPEDCQSNADIADFWAVRLDQAGLSAAENAELARWKDADPENPDRLVRARGVWQSMEVAASDLTGLQDTTPSSKSPKPDPSEFDVEGVRRDLERLGALEGGSGRLPGMRSAKRRPRPILALVTCLLLVGLWGYSALRPAPDLVAASDVAVVGEIHELSDGSRLWMEPGTRISLDYTAAKRDITILDGGIFIEVAKDATRPLSIQMNGVSAVAVGTAFSASKWGGHVRIEVAEGTVDLANTTSRLARLTAGRAAWQNGDGDLHYGAVALDKVAAWRSGRWVVQDMPIDELLARISPLVGDLTFVRDPRLGDITVSGSFDLSKPDSAHAALLAAYDLDERAFPGGFRIISRK